MTIEKIDELLKEIPVDEIIDTLEIDQPLADLADRFSQLADDFYVVEREPEYWCSYCEGTGDTREYTRCRYCNGSGRANAGL